MLTSLFLFTYVFWLLCRLFYLNCRLVSCPSFLISSLIFYFATLVDLHIVSYYHLFPSSLSFLCSLSLRFYRYVSSSLESYFSFFFLPSIVLYSFLLSDFLFFSSFFFPYSLLYSFPLRFFDSDFPILLLTYFSVIFIAFLVLFFFILSISAVPTLLYALLIPFLCCLHLPSLSSLAFRFQLVCSVFFSSC